MAGIKEANCSKATPDFKVKGQQNESSEVGVNERLNEIEGSTKDFCFEL